MDMVITEDDIKNIIKETLEEQGYTVESVSLGFDPQLTKSKSSNFRLNARFWNV